SDTSFGSSAAVFDHWAATRLRAIEIGRDVVWASNGGPSGVFSALGAWRASLGHGATGLALLEAEHRRDRPPVRAREAPLLIALAIGLLLCVSRASRHNVAPPGPLRFSAGVGGAALVLVFLSSWVVAWRNGANQARPRVATSPGYVHGSPVAHFL